MPTDIVGVGNNVTSVCHHNVELSWGIQRRTSLLTPEACLKTLTGLSVHR